MLEQQVERRRDKAESQQFRNPQPLQPRTSGGGQAAPAEKRPSANRQGFTPWRSDEEVRLEV